MFDDLPSELRMWSGRPQMWRTLPSADEEQQSLPLGGHLCSETWVGGGGGGGGGLAFADC